MFINFEAFFQGLRSYQVLDFSFFVPLAMHKNFELFVILGGEVYLFFRGHVYFFAKCSRAPTFYGYIIFVLASVRGYIYSGLQSRDLALWLISDFDTYIGIFKNLQ